MENKNEENEEKERKRRKRITSSFKPLTITTGLASGARGAAGYAQLL